MDKTLKTTINLIHQFLSDQGYQKTLESFKLECPQVKSMPVGKSLLTLVQEMLDCEAGSTMYSFMTHIYILNRNNPSIPSIEPVKQLEFPKSNVASTLLSCPAPIISISTLQMENSRLLTSSTDKIIRLWNLETRQVMHSINLDAISLTLTVHPLTNQFLSTCMDGSCHLIESESLQILQSFKNHSKYVVASVFSPDGHWMITGSHDKMVQIYTRDEQDEVGNYKLYESLYFKGAIESLCLINCESSNGIQTLVVAVRNDHQLYTVLIKDQSTAQIQSHNMNANGDDWVSFTALNISSSPCGTYLLLITDTPSGRILVYETKTWKKIQDIWGNLKIDRFSNPRGLWITNHHYIIADDEGCLTYMDISCHERIGHVSLHNGPIRSLSRLNNTIFTGSFDKMVKSLELEILDR